MVAIFTGSGILHSIVNHKGNEMKVYIVNYRGTVYGVFDSREKAQASEYGDLYDTNIMEMELQ